jgi:hypothetical protein
MIRRDGDFVPVLYDTKTGTPVAGFRRLGANFVKMSFARLFAACGVVLMAAVALPANAADGAYPSFLGATLGQPAQELRATLGDPILVTAFPDALIKAGRTIDPTMPSQRTARFWIPPATTTFALISERDGVVTSIELFVAGIVTGPIAGLPASPTGVSIGMAVDDAISRRGAPAAHTESHLTYAFKGGIAETYGIQNGLINSITFLLLPTIATSTINPNAGPSLAPFREPDGMTPDTAILDMMPKEDPGVRWEYIYLAFHPCDGTTQWKRPTRSMVVQGARRFDKFHLVCETTHTERDLWFDITPYFGKL